MNDIGVHGNIGQICVRIETSIPAFHLEGVPWDLPPNDQSLPPQKIEKNKYIHSKKN